MHLLALSDADSAIKLRGVELGMTHKLLDKADIGPFSSISVALL